MQAALASPGLYPGADGVEVRETHISWVFLAGDRAYKLKKPLVLPFLDYGTAARRHEMCREEVRLNRRLAPDVYLGVRGIAAGDAGFELVDEDDSRAADYVVEMRRYDDHATAAAKLRRGELTSSEVRDTARKLAAFHARCAPVRSAGALAIEREIDRNVQELLGIAEQFEDRLRIRRVHRFLAAFIAAHRREFESRASHGRIRECHGDLRAEHVVLEHGVEVVDCVEFDPGLRTLDVADDLAFLAMDLEFLGGERFARTLVGSYRAAGGDCGSDALVACFAAHRALVRAKVVLTRAGQYPPSSPEHGDASLQARELVSLAERQCWRARLPMVLVICGVPASGKSHLAQRLARCSGLPVVSSDLVRKRLAGIRPYEHAPAERYSEPFSLATYRELGRSAAAEVSGQGGAIVDATFRHRTDRAAFSDAFADRAPATFVECLAPGSVLEERAQRRQHDPSPVSDATVEIVRRESRSWEPLDEVPPERHVAVRTDRRRADILADLTATLDARMTDLGHP